MFGSSARSPFERTYIYHHNLLDCGGRLCVAAIAQTHLSILFFAWCCCFRKSLRTCSTTQCPIQCYQRQSKRDREKERDTHSQLNFIMLRIKKNCEWLFFGQLLPFGICTIELFKTHILLRTHSRIHTVREQHTALFFWLTRSAL